MLKENIEVLTLIQNTLDRKPRAEKIFYNKYKEVIKNYIKYKYPKYNINIDDYVSDILIQVFCNLQKYNPEKSTFKSWVLVVARNYMIDKWRSNTIDLTSNNIQYNGEFILSNDSSVSCSFCENWEEGANTTLNNVDISFTTSGDVTLDSCNSVSYISEQLSPEDFTLLDMKYVQGYNYCEIGKEFNLTSTTISNKVNYIKTKIKKNYSKDIYD